MRKSDLHQITSGTGPAECRLAVAKFLDFLRNRFDIDVVRAVSGGAPGTLKSVHFRTSDDISGFCGTNLWICPSPFRPNHKRKNWFFGLRRLDESVIPGFDESRVRFSTMRAGGPGGQNVNKVETAVRAVYGDIVVVCSDERSQLMNRRRALERVRLEILERAEAARELDKREGWRQHAALSRGDAVAVFEGPEFRLARGPRI